MCVCLILHTCLLVFYVRMKRLGTLPSLKADTLLTAVPELAGLTVHSRQQQSGSLPDIIAVHREASSVFGVNHSHAHPLHQRRQHHERPMGGDRCTYSGHHRLKLHEVQSQLGAECAWAHARKIHLIQNLQILFWRSCLMWQIFENRLNSKTEQVCYINGGSDHCINE